MASPALPVSGYSDPKSRAALIKRLSNLPVAQLDQIIFALDPPRGNIPATSAAPASRVSALLEWVENPDIGCGWAALEEVVDELLPREAEVETLQGWLLAHPYGMPPHFTGRRAELQMLSDWLESSQQPLFVLRALGGFGKSAVTWHWLTKQVSRDEWPRVVWWSFYEASASFDNFLRSTLAYLTGREPKNVPSRQQLEQLLRLMQQQRVLLVMDGFERELRAYGGMGAAYQGDEIAGDSNSPPSPPNLGETGVQNPDLGGQQGRDCISPLAEDFLRAVASLPNLQGKVLMSTRLRPRAVELHGGTVLQGCREEELTALQPEDAVALFRAQGIQGNRTEIQQACDNYGYHPLSLRLLVGFILENFEYPGDIKAAESLDLTGDLVQRRNHVLERSYKNLSPQARQLLNRMACFRSPVQFVVLETVERTGQEESDVGAQSLAPLQATLRNLVQRGLVHFDPPTKRFDLHPIVRRYAYDRMAAAERTNAHGQLRDYFAAVPEVEKVTTLEDLAPVIELYHHMVRAGQYDEAFALFLDRLHNSLYYQLGAYQIYAELLRALFPQGEDQLPQLKDEGAQCWTLTALANSYSLSGQPAEAIPLFERQIAIREKQGVTKSIAIGLGNLAYQQLPIGALQAAEANLRRSIALCQKIEDEFDEAISHRDLGRLLVYRGLWAESAAEFDQALELFEQQSIIQSQGIVWAYRALGALLQVRAGEVSATDTALTAATRALELADETARILYPHERDHVRAHWLLGAAHRVNGELSQSDHHLSESLRRCRAINVVEHEADILLDLARLRADQDQPDAALRLAQEALIITDRSGYVLQGADVHLFLAQQALTQGDRTEALTHAQQARQLAHCDGGDYTYKVAYDEAGQLLQQLR